MNISLNCRTDEATGERHSIVLTPQKPPPPMSSPSTQVVDGLIHSVSLARVDASVRGDGRLRADCTQ